MTRERLTDFLDALPTRSPHADPEPIDLGHRARIDPRLRPPARQRQLEQDRAALAARQNVINADRAAVGERKS